MQIRLLDAAGARQLYESRMARDFPPGELKPFAAVEELLAAGLYEPLTFTDDAGAVLAYAWQVVLPGQQAGLVDYFAVRSDLRGSGIGTRALHLLQTHYAPRLAALLLECEHPAEAERSQAAHRILSAGRGAGHGAGKPGVRRAVRHFAAALRRSSAAGQHAEYRAANAVQQDGAAALLPRQRNILRQLGPYYPRKGVET